MKNNKELTLELQEWFNNNDSTKPNFWTRNPVAIVIKNNLNILGKWKYKARGNPKLGRQKMLAMQEAKKLDKKLSW